MVLSINFIFKYLQPLQPTNFDYSLSSFFKNSNATNKQNIAKARFSREIDVNNLDEASIKNVDKIVESLLKLKTSNRELREKNVELNEMIVELKLIIARIYNKIYK